MKNSTIRLIFILASIIAAGIIATQVYWVHSAYNLTEEEFNLNVNISLRETAEKLWQNKNKPLHISNIVERYSPDCYLVNIDSSVDSAELEKNLYHFFTLNNVITNFGIAIYNPNDGKIVTQKYIEMKGSIPQRNTKLDFPDIKKGTFTFAVYFPHRTAYHSIQLRVWTITSIALLAAISFMAYIVFMILKQKRLSEVQRDFVNNMTHEFKTPLATIQIASEVLQKPDIVNEPQRLLNYATIIDKEAKNLTNHVERVLSIVRADKVGLPLTHEPISWPDLLNDVYQSMQQKLKQRKGHLEIHIEQKNLPFVGDTLHLKNMINNLVDNSIKYSQKDPNITISVRAHDTKWMEIEVEDNGIGIKPEDQKRLFEKFYRVSTGNIHDVKGFGLGLSYVQIVAQAHNGKVICKSLYGIGTTFTIMLPLAK